jgi:hypothetical protein
MHTLHEKRGNKVVTHHFDHVTEKDGTKRHVYLGTDPKASREKITKLRAQRIHSDNKLIKELDSVQQKLHAIGNFDQSFDSLLADIKTRNAKKSHAEHLLGDEESKNKRYFFILIAVAVLTAAAYYAISSPAVTGAVTMTEKVASGIASNNMFSSAFTILGAVFLLGLVFHGMEYVHNHRYDRFKPPE